MFKRRIEKRFVLANIVLAIGKGKKNIWVVKLTTHSCRLHFSRYEAATLQRFTALKATCFPKNSWQQFHCRTKPARYVQSQLFHYVLLICLI